MDAATGRRDTQRWLAPIVTILALATGIFGASLFLAPDAVAGAFGLVGSDVFLYRLAGAAILGFPFALAGAWRNGWPALRITVTGMATFSAASIIAALVAYLTGEGTAMAGLILVGSAILLGLELLLLRDPPGPSTGAGNPDIAQWVVALLAFGGIAALGTGALAFLLGGLSGKVLAGYSGADAIIYREAGAATLGAAYGAYAALQSRRWEQIGRGLWGAFVFNGLGLVAAILEIARGNGGPNLLSVAILGVTVVVTAGLAVSMARRGR
jgi:hypothetical protein